MAYIDDYIDEDFDPPTDWTIESIAKEEIRRLSRTARVADEAADRPRRLGADADAFALARDKKQARGVAHACRSAMSAWLTEDKEGKEANFVGDELKRIKAEAGRIDFEEFVVDQRAALTVRATKVATWAVANHDRRFGNRAVGRLLSEIERLEWAVRK